MFEHVEAAFVFGTLGNLPEALVEGWSVEDNYAWAIGSESLLRLPLPGDATPYLLRLTLRPLLRPGQCDAQRLGVDSLSGPLTSFSITEQTSIELPLPIELTRDRRHLELILRHPDALRPSDFLPSDDRRLLSLRFMSGVLVREVAEGPEAQAASLRHLIVAGGDLARQLAQVMTALIDAVPALRQRIACHFVDIGPGPDGAPPPREELQSAAICWEQAGADQAAAWSGLRGMLPADCDIRRFAAPRMSALWPFLGADQRLVHEPDVYPGGRYPFGDRIGASLAYLQLPDDVMLLSYQSMTEAEMPDLDALLSADRAAWRTLDATQDVKLADFIVENFRRYRLFFAPTHLTGDLLREMIGQLLAGSPIEALCAPAKLRRGLDALLNGYIGRREELPIHPHVAQRLGLAWCEPGMRYRWHGNRWTFEESALRYIRWTPWRP